MRAVPAVGFETSYLVRVPGGTIGRCNPVNAPEGCKSTGLDLASSTPPGR